MTPKTAPLCEFLATRLNAGSPLSSCPRKIRTEQPPDFGVRL